MLDSSKSSTTGSTGATGPVPAPLHIHYYPCFPSPTIKDGERERRSDYYGKQQCGYIAEVTWTNRGRTNEREREIERYIGRKIERERKIDIVFSNH